MSQLKDAVSASLKHFKDYDALRPEQKKVIEKFVNGNDVFVSLPTGYGKSLCYWILSLIFNHLRARMDSIAIVVSPLVSLMIDQVDALAKNKLKAIYVGGADEDCREQIKQGKFSILFFSPESLLRDLDWRDMLHSPVYQQKLVAFVVDEAHCVKMWGKKFRREFSNLAEVRSLIPSSVNFMALTATATRTSRSEICRVLGMQKAEVVSISPNKSNIMYFVHVEKGASVEKVFDPLIEELKSKRKSLNKTLIFCRSYDTVVELFFYMRALMGDNAREPANAPDLVEYRLFDMYTACVHQDLKPLIVKQFTIEDSVLRIVIATIAFGMGINCPNIRRVIHWGPPGDIESYIQETGRAGRDGKQAKAILYITTSVSSYVASTMNEYCMNTNYCRRKLLFKDFDSDTHRESIAPCECCDVCAMICECANCISQ